MSAVSTPPLEQLLRRDRRLVVAALVLVAALAWIYTLAGVGMEMSAFEMTRAVMPGQQAAMGMATHSATPTGEDAWDAGDAAVMLAMWWVMMVAMMLPSAAPVILLAAAINRRSGARNAPYGSAGFFTAGYLLLWLVFSATAVALQWSLTLAGLVSPMLESTSSRLAAALLIAAGLWQLTPIKQACLRHCRSPVHYLVRHRRPGNFGALVMGAGHGSFCLGCCWFLMALLFAGGVMNLYWIVGLALFVLVEKTLARGVWFSRVAGLGLIAAGVTVAAL